ncbi:LamG domain-containing protein, partial [Candidatus Sumerlaeota bacterium]|nr:LamG domain-containing protein [Candidatus Sumerlaeota bacterium]
NKWTHVGAVWTGTAWQLYINGVLVKETSHAGHHPVWGGSRMGIGTMNWSYGFHGKIDEVQFFGSLMTPEQMACIYVGEIINSWRGFPPAQLMGMWSMNGTTEDQSIYDNHGTLHNGASYTPVQSGFGQAILLDGVDDQIRISNTDHFKNFRRFYISAWIYPTSYKNGDTIISKSNPDCDFNLQLMADGRLNVYHTADSVVCGVTSNEVIPLNQWSYVAAEWSYLGYWKLFYNGKLIKTSNRFLDNDNHVISPPWTGTQMGIGTLGGIDTFAGMIDEVKIFADALREEQILDEYMSRARSSDDDFTEFVIDALPYQHSCNSYGYGNDWDVNGDMPDGADVAYKLVLTDFAIIDINLCNSVLNYNVYVEIFDESGATTGYGHFFESNPTYCSSFNDVYLNPGVYYIVVDGFYGAYGNHEIHVDYAR